MKKRLIFLVAALLWTAFIWHNSLQPAELSGEASGNIVELVQPVLDAVGVPEEQHSFVVRKCAHMTEFAVLALLWTGCLGEMPRGIILTAVFCLITAGVDETIQRFVPDRGPSIFDVGIDTCGVLTGMLLICIGHSILSNSRK